MYSNDDFLGKVGCMSLPDFDEWLFWV